jgi:hypothetical protein
MKRLTIRQFYRVHGGVHLDITAPRDGKRVVRVLGYRAGELLGEGTGPTLGEALADLNARLWEREERTGEAPKKVEQRAKQRATIKKSVSH